MKKEFNFDEEERYGYITSKKMKKVWKVELDMLEEFDRVCKKYNLTYFADSGTLLGIARDNRFIPWDDDIDLVMKRKDYDKLMEIGPKEFKHPYFFQSTFTEKNFIRVHSQIRNSETTAILPSEIGKKYNQGIFIDIFPLDYLSKYKIFNVIKRERLKFLYKRMNLKINGIERSNNNLKNFLKKTVLFFDKNKTILEMFEKYEKICRKTLFPGDYIDSVAWYSLTNRIHYLKESWYEKSIYVDFENIKISVPNNKDDILKQHYGEDYIKPKNIPSRHGEVIFDTNISYIDYLKGKKINEK